jgi:hypothetical protein
MRVDFAAKPAERANQMRVRTNSWLGVVFKLANLPGVWKFGIGRLRHYCSQIIEEHSFLPRVNLRTLLVGRHKSAFPSITDMSPTIQPRQLKKWIKMDNINHFRFWMVSGP